MSMEPITWGFTGLLKQNGILYKPTQGCDLYEPWRIWLVKASVRLPSEKFKPEKNQNERQCPFWTACG